MAFFMVEEMRTILFFSENKRIERKWYLVYNMFKICFWECYNLLFLEIFFFRVFQNIENSKNQYVDSFFSLSLSLLMEAFLIKKNHSFLTQKKPKYSMLLWFPKD